MPARGVDRTSATARGLRMGIGFTTEMIAMAIMPHIYIQGGNPMTAYLISLALVGLIAIAVWEGCT